MFECGAKRTAHSRYRQTKSAFGVIGVLIRPTRLMSLLKMDVLKKKGTKCVHKSLNFRKRSQDGWFLHNLISEHPRKQRPGEIDLISRILFLKKWRSLDTHTHQGTKSCYSTSGLRSPTRPSSNHKLSAKEGTSKPSSISSANAIWRSAHVRQSERQAYIPPPFTANHSATQALS